jgi:hypothetical protein
MTHDVYIYPPVTIEKPVTFSWDNESKVLDWHLMAAIRNDADQR